MTERSAPAPRVLCFGEILWDFLPDGLFPGGAPFNVAYHLHRQHLDVTVVSAVGRDVLGDELLRRLRDGGIATTSISCDPARPTGYVRAAIGPRGDAHYDIVSDVAWDHIAPSADTLGLAATADALIFGSLAARSPSNRAALAQLRAVLSSRALRVFDVNLRPPFDDLALVRELARDITVLKLNAAEAARLAGDSGDGAGREQTHAARLAAAFNVPLVVITADARGAGLWREGVWHWEQGRPVEVADTVGAGDAFLATLVAGLLARDRPDREVLARACRVGEWVASQRGATPAYSASSSFN